MALVERTQLIPGTAEYEEVAEKFNARSMLKDNKMLELVSIERVHNSALERRFLDKKLEYEETYGHVSTVKGWHGTKQANVAPILKHNFDVSKHGTGVGTRYGAGVSFSSMANYASYYCDKKAPTTSMLLADVLVSNTVEVPENRDRRTALREPPRLPGSSLRYDTTAKNLDKMDVFVKFEEDTFLPTHVVHFRCTDRPAFEDLPHSFQHFGIGCSDSDQEEDGWDGYCSDLDFDDGDYFDSDLVHGDDRDYLDSDQDVHLGDGSYSDEDQDAERGGNVLVNQNGDDNDSYSDFNEEVEDGGCYSDEDQEVEVDGAYSDVDQDVDLDGGDYSDVGEGVDHDDGDCCDVGEGVDYDDGDYCDVGEGVDHDDGDCCDVGEGVDYDDGDYCDVGGGVDHDDGDYCDVGEGVDYDDGDYCDVGGGVDHDDGDYCDVGGGVDHDNGEYCDVGVDHDNGDFCDVGGGVDHDNGDYCDVGGGVDHDNGDYCDVGGGVDFDDVGNDGYADIDYTDYCTDNYDSYDYY